MMSAIVLAAGSLPRVLDPSQASLEPVLDPKQERQMTAAVREANFSYGWIWCCSCCLYNIIHVSSESIHTTCLTGPIKN